MAALSPSLSLSVFFYLTRPQSLSITLSSPAISLFFLLSPHFLTPPPLFTFFHPHLTLLPVPMPNGFEQGSPPPCPHTSPILFWGLFNWIGSQSITVSIELWLDLARAGGVGWVGILGKWLDFSSAPMKVELMCYCYGHTDRTSCVCVGGWVDDVCDCGWHVSWFEVLKLCQLWLISAEVQHWLSVTEMCCTLCLMFQFTFKTLN